MGTDAGTVRERLTILAHTAPVRVVASPSGARAERVVGGLVSALMGVLRRKHHVWVALPVKGADTEQVNAAMPCAFAPVAFDQASYEGFYWHVANGTLWPLYHSLPQYVLPFCPQHWESYKAVNVAFARTACGTARRDGWVWIHDYHLSLAPALLRQNAGDWQGKIAFFLHTPFPCWDIFRTLPCHKEILQGMLGADRIGFHTDSYRANFSHCVRNALGIEPDPNEPNTLLYQGRRIQLRVAPVGVDARGIKQRAQQSDVCRAAQKLREHINVEFLLLGVDRLDYTKGIDARLRIFEALLESEPRLRGRVTLLQLCVPTRGRLTHYQQLRAQVEQLVGHINGRFGEPGWVPVISLHHGLPPDQLPAWYVAADMLLVTPWRDGMNLVAQEYVAAHAERPGSLVLSRFAGAAEKVLRDAVLINPGAPKAAARRIAEELRAPPEHKQAGLQHLFHQLTRCDVNGFADACLGP
ncbi:MAG: trehalose-6-phosphate synthase [Myxococcota bacterium]